MRKRKNIAGVNSSMIRRPIRRWAPLFILPTFLAFCIGFIWPFIQGIYLSFCNFNTPRDAVFEGLKNYTKVFQDAGFLNAFKNTAAFAVVSIILINVLAFFIAYALTQKLRGANLFRTVFFMPNLIGGVVLGYIWSLIFDGILKNYSTYLTASGTYGFWGLVILVAWQQIGYMMIIYIAGLQAVSEDMLEAAKIDGAGEVRTFVDIVFPMIKPGVGALAIFTFINAWNDYFLQLIMLNSQSKLTISLGIAKMQAEASTDFGLIMAGATLASVPIITIFLIFQKYFTKGIAMGAVKG